MWEYNTRIVLLGVSLLGAAAGLVGGFAVLRKQALFGDAVAHASLPGLCIGALLAGERAFLPMLLGAILSGLAGVGVLTLLRKHTRVRPDAAIGLVLSVFFGVGVSLVSVVQRTDAIGGNAGIESFLLGKTAGMIAADVIQIGIVASLAMLIISVRFADFRLVSFDPDYARVIGLPVAWLDALLLGLMVLTVVIGLPAVGVVLIAALLILPAASMRFWTDQLPTLLIGSAILGAATGCAGAILSASGPDLPTGPIVTLVGTAGFVISLLFGRRRGVVVTWWKRRQLRRQSAGGESTC
ncbi:manganese abc transporter : Manganese ABC transporter permease OS=Bacillus simplex GN=BN1180_00438 PE=4 SV=1: ABC-3 [Tuwongella immobilis]|uniref:Uncharacterized protein n=2 Tax=Tuwongella immobilis TaxID=692036 RepID=A0A6C2YLW6_9BACT|nr:manganese abc transporter : Manganese ABC transporter permease OS=Bacillus simplex GN=BN1180_00438 PE=4 SV=1: ABC-3 [Tuwongella immobilis]VTS01178.1 manganese abc transporter : Manganese ABC transporter permease OS=Bacillus simplex GN=BN1180_00438 PE=4 SV=1: ABC-3 [Tuwongella immobilis]